MLPKTLKRDEIKKLNELSKHIQYQGGDIHIPTSDVQDADRKTLEGILGCRVYRPYVRNIEIAYHQKSKKSNKNG